MSTHNICFHGKLEKIILELSSNTPPYQVSWSYFSTKTCCAYTLEAPLQGASNEYKICLHGEIRKLSLVFD